jgi:Single-strand binding protein family
MRQGVPSLCTLALLSSLCIVSVTAWSSGGIAAQRSRQHQLQRLPHWAQSLSAVAKDDTSYFDSVDEEDEERLSDEDLEATMGDWNEKVARFNTVHLSGRVGNNPEARYFDDGKVVVNLSMASKRKYHTMDRKANDIKSGEEATDWYGLEIWVRSKANRLCCPVWQTSRWMSLRSIALFMPRGKRLNLWPSMWIKELVLAWLVSCRWILGSTRTRAKNAVNPKSSSETWTCSKPRRKPSLDVAGGVVLSMTMRMRIWTVRSRRDRVTFSIRSSADEFAVLAVSCARAPKGCRFTKSAFFGCAFSCHGL